MSGRRRCWAAWGLHEIVEFGVVGKCAVDLHTAAHHHAVCVDCRQILDVHRDYFRAGADVAITGRRRDVLERAAAEIDAREAG